MSQKLEDVAIRIVGIVESEFNVGINTVAHQKAIDRVLKVFGVFKADNVIVPQEEIADLEAIIARHKNIQFQIIAKNRRERDALADNQMLWNKLTDKITELLGLKQKET